MTIESSIVFVISLILLWIKPGPGQAAVIARSLSDGFLAGFSIAVAIMVGNSIYFLIAALGLTSIINLVEEIGYVMKIVGAIYLFYLGYKGLANVEKGKMKKAAKVKPRPDIAKNFLTGLLITLSNPFVIFFYIALLPGLVPLNDLALLDLVIAVAIILYFGLTVYAILIALVTQVKVALSNTEFVRKVNIITSIGFILIGAFFLYSTFFVSDYSFTLE